jgi:hypothetical protein
MTPLSSLLRQERLQRRVGRCMAALTWLALAVAVVAPRANGTELRPDASTKPAPAGLQPDAFPGSAAPVSAKAAAPAHPSGVGGSLVEVPQVRVPATPPSTTKLTEPATARPIHVTTAPPAAPVEPRAVAPVRRAAKQHTVVRVRLPRAVGGRLSVIRLPRGVSSSLALPTHPPYVLPAVSARPRNLVPAALALLALVATSGCLLGAAARAARHGLDA